MQTRLGVLSLILIIICGLFLGVTRFVGQPSTVPQIFQSSPDCQIDCWNGIHLGKTTIGEAETILREQKPRWIDKPYGDSSLYWGGSSPTINGQIADMDGKGIAKGMYLKLYDESTLTLGDAIVMWGTPIATKVVLCNSERPPLMIYFKGSITAYIYDSKQDDRRGVPLAITPTATIWAVEYDDPAHFSMIETRQWHGFRAIKPDDILEEYCG